MPKRRRAPAAFSRPVRPDAALAAIVGSNPISRAQITKRVWAHIKRKGLQDADDGRMINCDAALKKVTGRCNISMFQMTKKVSQHVR